MTEPKPDLAAAARALNALVERMQGAVAEYLPPDSGIDGEELALQLIEALDGPEQKAAQGALKAALAEDPGDQEYLAYRAAYVAPPALCVGCGCPSSVHQRRECQVCNCQRYSDPEAWK